MLLLPMLEMLDSDEERAKFEKFYYKYTDLVMWVSLNRLHDFHLAEECSQDTFLTLAKNFSKVGDVDSEQTRGYVYTVANGLAINKYNREIKREPVKEELTTLFDIADESFDIYDSSELKSAVSGLSEAEKTYFRLKYLYGYTLKEIAAMFDESVSNVSKKLIRIKAKLKEGLDSDEQS